LNELTVDVARWIRIEEQGLEQDKHKFFSAEVRAVKDTIDKTLESLEKLDEKLGSIQRQVWCPFPPRLRC
jgi:hypothetical protein